MSISIDNCKNMLRVHMVIGQQYTINEATSLINATAVVVSRETTKTSLMQLADEQKIGKGMRRRRGGGTYFFYKRG